MRLSVGGSAEDALADCPLPSGFSLLHLAQGLTPTPTAALRSHPLQGSSHLTSLLL